MYILVLDIFYYVPTYHRAMYSKCLNLLEK